MVMTETVCAASGSTILEVKTEKLCLQIREMLDAAATFNIDAANQVHKNLDLFVGDATPSGRQERGWIRCRLADLRAFGIRADQWVIVAQQGDEWCKPQEGGWQREQGLHHVIQQHVRR